LSSGVLVSANQVGLSLRDVGAALDTMTSRGIPAQQAATRLRMTFSLMAAPTEKAKSALKGVGLDSTALAEQMQKPAGLLRALSLLKAHLSGLSKIEQTQVLSEAFGGARSGTTMMALIQNLDDVRERFRRIGQSAGNFGEKLKEVKEASGFKLDVAWSQLQAALIHLGDELLPAVVPAFQSLVGVVSKLGHWFNALPEGTKKLIVEAGLVAAALGPVLWIGGKLLTTYARLKLAVLGATEAFAAMRTASTAAALAGGADMFGINAAAAKAAGGTAGMTLARSLVSGLVRFIGPAVAVAGLANIVVSATKGDWVQAGGKLGGALAGGIAGFMLGGPMGAMLGAGAGSFLGGIATNLVSSIFSSGKKLSPLQQELARATERLSEAMHGQATAGRNLAQANQRVDAAHQRQRTVTAAVKRAEDSLAAARKRYGRSSNQAALAEARLRNQKALSLAADRRAANAERLHGVARTAAIRADRATISAAKERTTALQRQYQHVAKLLRLEQQQPPSKARLEGEQRLYKQLNDIGKRLTSTRQTETRVVKEAATQIGQKFARSLERLSASQLRIIESGRTLKQANREAAEAVFGFSRRAVAGTGRVKTSYERLRGAMGPFRSESHNKLVLAAGDVRSWQQATTGGIGVVQTSFNQFAHRLGISGAQFGVTAGGKQRGGPVGFQGGGFTVPGNAVGDVFNTALPLGSFVLNKKATAAYGFQAGGLMPVALEPRERVFLPPEVKKIGPASLEAMNRAVPRFQEGGEVGKGSALGGFKPPLITGPDPLRTVGQQAVNKVFRAALRVLQHAAGAGTYAAVLKEANRIDALKLPYVWGGGHQSSPAPPSGPFDCSGAVSALLQGAGFHIPTMVSSGFESFGLPGKGQVSVLANPEHVYTVIGGRAWGTSGENPGGGAGWINGYTYRSGFTVRHADVLNLGQVPHGRTGKGQPAKKGFARGGFLKRLVGASTYGGPADHVSGTVGAAGVSLPGKMAYAELDMGKALGGLPFHFKLKISRAGRSVVAEKLDIGGGGDPVNGRPRAIDLWYDTAKALGVIGTSGPQAWLGVVQVDDAGGASTGGTQHNVPAKVHGSYGQHKAGETGAGGTFGQGVKHKYTAQTAALKFGPLPKTEQGCLRELYHLEKVLLPEYRAAAKQHADKGTASALRANQQRIEKRIGEVRKQLRTLRVAKSKKRLTKRLARALKRITGWEGAIETAQRAYEAASQYAEQVVSAEPVEGGDLNRGWVESVLAPYITGQEEPAYAEVLGREAAWRNTIIKAQTAVGNTEHRWVGGLSDLAGRIGGVHSEIEKDNRRVAHLRDLIREHPGAKERPNWESERDGLLNALPGLHQRLQAMRARRKQIAQALSEAKGSWDPWQGTGSFEEAMVQVQGIHWPAQHEVLAALPAVPVPGMFGGAIWDTQSSIQELGLKIKQAIENASGGEGEGSGEKATLLEQLWREERERLAISQAQYKVFKGATDLPFMGAFSQGGVALVGERGPELAHLPSGTRVHSATDTTRLISDIRSTVPEPQVVTRVVVEDGAVDPEKIRVEARKVYNKRERTTARGVSKRTPGRSGVFGGQ